MSVHQVASSHFRRKMRGIAHVTITPQLTYTSNKPNSSKQHDPQVFCQSIAVSCARWYLAVPEDLQRYSWWLRIPVFTSWGWQFFPLFTKVYTSQVVVWDFFHQQYVDSFHPFPNIHNFMTCSEPQGHGSQVFEWHRVMPKPPTNPVYTIVYIFIKTKCIVSHSIYIYLYLHLYTYT